MNRIWIHGLVVVSLAAAGSACGGGDATADAEPPELEPVATDVAEAAPEPVPYSVTIPLSARNDSGFSGRATLTRIDDESTRVVVRLFGNPQDAQPAHIHGGTCGELGAIAFPLNTLSSGYSATRIDARLRDLLRGTYALNVHASEENADAVACGGISSSGPTDTRDGYDIGFGLCAQIPMSSLAERVGGELQDAREIARDVARAFRPELVEDVERGCMAALEQNK